MTEQPTPRFRSGGSAWGPERVRLGISLRELSRRSGIDKAILSMAENGRLIPSAAEYESVTRVLRDAQQPGDNAA